MEDPERPGPDATSAEIAEWMEKDFGQALAKGIENAVEKDDPDDQHEVVEVEIINHQQGEIVGTIDTEGNLETKSEALRNVSQKYIKSGVPVLVPTTYENENGETVHTDGEVVVEPGTRGFVRAFVDELPSPYDCEPTVLAELPVHDEI